MRVPSSPGLLNNPSYFNKSHKPSNHALPRKTLSVCSRALVYGTAHAYGERYGEHLSSMNASRAYAARQCLVHPYTFGLEEYPQPIPPPIDGVAWLGQASVSRGGRRLGNDVRLLDPLTAADTGLFGWDRTSHIPFPNTADATQRIRLPGDAPRVRKPAQSDR